MRSTTSHVSQYHRESEKYNCAQHIATHPRRPLPLGASHYQRGGFTQSVRALRRFEPIRKD